MATVHVGHSPDPDDAFMFYALTFGKLDTAPESYQHHLLDIETLNQKAERGEYEVTALSFHAYAHVADRYVLLPHGASFGDGYGPLIVARQTTATDFASARRWLNNKRIAIPGKRTSAYLALRLFADEARFDTTVVPFDQIMPKVAAGEFDGGVIIHEGQLTYFEERSGGLKKIVDLGEWWKAETGLPLPLGGNGIRRDLGEERIARISGHLHQSIRWGLEHRDEALGYALKYARDMERDQADRFVGMYVNDYTLAYGARGREAVSAFLRLGRERGVLSDATGEPQWTAEH